MTPLGTVRTVLNLKVNSNENKLGDDNDNDDNHSTTRSRGGGELRSAIPVTTSNNVTPPSPVVAITPLPMGHKNAN